MTALLDSLKAADCKLAALSPDDLKLACSLMRRRGRLLARLALERPAPTPELLNALRESADAGNRIRERLLLVRAQAAAEQACLEQQLRYARLHADPRTASLGVDTSG